MDNDIDPELVSNDGSVVSNASTVVKRSVGNTYTNGNSNNRQSPPVSHPIQKVEINSANLKRWIEETNIEMLEGVVLEGQGDRLRQKASTVLKDFDNNDSQSYIEETVPAMMSRIQNIHAAVSIGDLSCLQEGIEKKKDYILSKDHQGMTPLHKATIMGHVDVVQYILEKFPETVNARDREGRSALHYSTATTNRNGNKIYKMLVRAGADPRVRDVHGKSPDYYRVHLLSIPSETLRGSMGKSTNKTINSYQKTVGGLLGETNTRARRITQPGTREKINQALHSGNVAHLQELVLDGYGQELVGRTSFGEEARKYLKTIPQSLGTIRELQESVVNGDQATVQRILVDAPHFARARDSNSFTLMHLAVIGGHLPLVNYFVNNFASIINLKDNMNRTALHLAALTGNSDIYRRLIELSFDPRSMDQKGKTADHYLRNNPAISSNELQELLALGNGIAAPNGPQASTRLTRLSKATSKSNLANGTDSSITAGNTNGGLSPTSMKPSSKPVRLPALSRPAGQKDGAEQNGIKSDEESKEDEDQGEQKVARVNGSTVQEETRDQPEEKVEHTIEQSSGNITPLTEENEPQSREASAKEHVIIYSRNNGDQSPWTQIEDESVDLVVTQNETTEQTDANGDEAIQQIEQTDQVKTDETTNQLTNENDGDLDESTEQINLSPEANQVAPKAEDVSEQTTNSVDDASGEEKFDELQENTEEALTEKPKEERTSWSRGSVADTSGNPSETTVDVSENDLSKQFASSTAKEVEILENVEVAPSKEEDMKVVYGTDPPQEDNFQSTQRNWSADTTIRSKSDPQLDWEGRQSSANIRYVIAKSSNSADSALKKDNAPKDNKPAKKKASKDPVIINQEAIDETMKTMPQEKGPWPETITEENELKADSASNEEKLEQVMEKADEDTVGFSFDKPKDDRLNELIKHWLEDCDLLRLEHVVIAGQGDRLLNIKSEDRQVQDFLNLVPAYMEKIRNVHHAVTQGNLEEVQKVLTRKRFALCRDQFGGSPLHLAVMHGHTDIVIYIITQFPETIDGPDNDGRSPFHYAAVLPEKQIYQILDTAGASKAQKDRLGYTAPDYLTNGQLTIRDLLLKYTREPEKEADKPADLWERPPTAEIVSQLTPESGSVPSSANGKDEPNQQISEDLPETVQDSENNKSVQVLQIEPREHFNMSLEENGIEDQSAVDSSTETVKQNGEKSDDNSEEKQSVKPTSIGKKPLKRTETFDRSKKQTDKSPVDDKTFETMSNEFNQSLRSEKIRLQKSTDQQIKSSEVIKAGQNGSVIDSIQSAQSSNIKITNGTSASGYDLTQIKDEQGRTVLHLAAAKDQKRNTFYKMLQQAKYLIPERDAKYRTIRDVAVQNGIKNNLQVIDQFIIDCFIAEQADYLRTLMIEGYTNLLSVVDPEGNDVIAILKKNNIASMESVIHDMATLEKNRDELHTFIRNEYVEGVINLVENDPQLVVAKSDRGRTSLHLAVLFGNLDIIEALINTNHQVINIPDNLGRTPLHYAMAMSKMEEIGRILIHNNANKLIRDVRMRIPTYYFVYKQEIRDIKREEQNLTL